MFLVGVSAVFFNEIKPSFMAGTYPLVPSHTIPIAFIFNYIQTMMNMNNYILSMIVIMAADKPILGQWAGFLVNSTSCCYVPQVAQLDFQSYPVGLPGALPEKWQWKLDHPARWSVGLTKWSNSAKQKMGWVLIGCWCWSLCGKREWASNLNKFLLKPLI